MNSLANYCDKAEKPFKNSGFSWCLQKLTSASQTVSSPRSQYLCTVTRLQIAKTDFCCTMGSFFSKKNILPKLIITNHGTRYASTKFSATDSCNRLGNPHELQHSTGERLEY